MASFHCPALAGPVSAWQSPGGVLSRWDSAGCHAGRRAALDRRADPAAAGIPAAVCNGCRSAACLHAGAMAPAERCRRNGAGHYGAGNGAS